MDRDFPRAARRRVIAALAACSVILGLGAIPPASADDDLDDRRRQVQGDIGQTLADLDQSSRDLVEATQALDAARGRLASAQDHLAKTRGELAAAVVLDRQMQAKLREAVARLQEARAELAEGRANIAEQERTLGELAVQSYQSGDPGMVGLAMVLSSHDPAQLTSQLNSVQNVMDKEAVTLDRLEATRVLLTVQEQEVAEAKREVAVQRQAAARNLERKQVLEERAEAAEQQVAALVEVRRSAYSAAVEAREADLARLRALQQERDRVTEMLRIRAEEARQRAEAAAAAAAAAATQSAAGTSTAFNAGGFLDYPVDGYITSPYGMRLHPIYKRWTLHDGTDFGAPCGTPVRAAAAGEVLEVASAGGYGKRVIIDHGFRRSVGLATAYTHLSAYAADPGQRVKRGDVVGYVGNTGYSTGCHLHFMVFENGATVNPMEWL